MKKGRIPFPVSCPFIYYLIAVADEKYFNHCILPPEMPRFALFYALFGISSRVTVFQKL